MHYERLLKQFPGYIYIANLNQEFIFCNEQGAKLIGFKNSADTLGLTAHDIRCKAVECADVFIEQDKEVINNKSVLNILDIHPFGNNNNVSILLSNKSPILDDNNNVTAVINHATKITHGLFFHMSMLLTKSEEKYRNKYKSKHRSYKIIQKYDKLTTRELECLFYLLRGKSMSSIAKILKLSERTIESHINKLKYKMGCHTKADIIEKAFNENFINFLPKSIFIGSNINVSEIIQAFDQQ